MLCIFILLNPCNPPVRYHHPHVTEDTVAQREEGAAKAANALGFSLVLISGHTGAPQSPRGYAGFQGSPTLDVSARGARDIL